MHTSTPMYCVFMWLCVYVWWILFFYWQIDEYIHFLNILCFDEMKWVEELLFSKLTHVSSTLNAIYWYDWLSWNHICIIELRIGTTLCQDVVLHNDVCLYVSRKQTCKWGWYCVSISVRPSVMCWASRLLLPIVSIHSYSECFMCSFCGLRNTHIYMLMPLTCNAKNFISVFFHTPSKSFQWLLNKSEIAGETKEVKLLTEYCFGKRH